MHLNILMHGTLKAIIEVVHCHRKKPLRNVWREKHKSAVKLVQYLKCRALFRILWSSFFASDRIFVGVLAFTGVLTFLTWATLSRWCLIRFLALFILDYGLEWMFAKVPSKLTFSIMHVVLSIRHSAAEYHLTVLMKLILALHSVVLLSWRCEVMKVTSFSPNRSCVIWADATSSASDFVMSEWSMRGRTSMISTQWESKLSIEFQRVTWQNCTVPGVFYNDVAGIL